MALQRNSEGVVIIFTGKMGSSKTLGAVRSAHNYYKKGYTIYSNFRIKEFPFTWVDRDLVRAMIKGDFQLDNAVLLLDEIHQIADCRMSGSKKNRFFSYLVNQSRKKSVRIIGTTQYFSMLDVRLRLATAVEVRCNKWFVGDLMRCHQILCVQRAPDDYIPVKEKFFWGNKYFKMYDTEEAIHLGDITIEDTPEEKAAKKAELNAKKQEAKQEAKEEMKEVKRKKHDAEKAKREIDRLQSEIVKKYLPKKGFSTEEI